MSTPKTIALSVLIALTVASNACSMIAIAARKGKVTRMYYFLFNLSVADALTAFLTLLPELVWTEAEPVLRDGGDFACRALKFVQMVAPYLRSAP
jgi:arginine vasopressin receptor 1A